MAVALVFGTPSRAALATTRTKYTVPFSPCAVQFYCATSEIYVEWLNAADGTARGSDYETIPQGQKIQRTCRRGEFAVSAAAGTPAPEIIAEPLS